MRYPTVLGFDTARAAHWARRTRDFLISAGTTLRLVVDLATGGVREVWLGDSHTVHLNRGYVTANFLRGRDGVYIVHLGSRLMYSVAAGGVPRWARRYLTLIAKASRRPVPLLVCLGEIDVRCHLAKHGSPGHWPLGFVDGFVHSTVALGEELGYAPVVFVVPPPPCRDHLSVGALPVVGDFPTRISAFETLRGELSQRCAETPGARYLDMTELVFDADNGIREDLTDDQCHVNVAGARLFRAAVDDFLA
ncbi:MAG TPA: hypothetical protein VJ872_17785 [Nocardioides sp.]|nr:hypothetical protein [Nocardioides sp.]